jgi:hypothetical protein
MFNFIKSIPIDLWFTIGASVISFLIGIAYGFIRIIKPKKCKNLWVCNKAIDFTKLHSQVNEILTELRIRLDSARTSITLFHNGGDFFSGESILKFSVTHQSCALGVDHSIDEDQGVLLTRFIEKLKLLQTNNSRLILTSSLPDSHYKGFLESRNTIAFVLVPLKRENSLNPYGYLCAEWCSWSHADKINETEMLTALNKDIRVLNTLLINK